MDETGVALGVCTNTRVIASSKKKKTYIKSPENREWVSVIECVSAAGRKLRCGVIFKGQSLQTSWFPSKSVPDWLYTTSENGWTSKAIGTEWLRRIFIPETAPQLNQHRLLLLDGHGSHVDVEFLWLYKQKKVELLFLPPHATHILQPLDLSVFSIVKSRYRNQIRELARLDDSAPVKKERFIIHYHKAREEGLSEKSQAQESLDIIHRTPQRAQDVYLSRRSLQKSENLSRSTRLVLQKAGKAISTANARAARQEEELFQLRHQLQTTTSTRKRKRIQVDLNERFANIDSIKSAIDETTAVEARRSSSTIERAVKITPRVEAIPSFSSMYNEWQLE
ncbi:hypothetical protein K3495_g11101 [Podosphaera aphanis]|nr:hypothetical protein K3495_g11101 [Podosphaera aphanis]